MRVNLTYYINIVLISIKKYYKRKKNNSLVQDKTYNIYSNIIYYNAN